MTDSPADSAPCAPFAPLSPWGAMIFCRVIDNFGDAGVCWRLAGRLTERGLRVLLVIDHPEVLAKMVPSLGEADARGCAGTQSAAGVAVMHWERFEALLERDPQGVLGDAPPRLVMETFGCRLPEAFEQRMDDGRTRLWMNLEYLTAEPYAGECHRLWGLHPTLGIRKLWFYPGFTPETGGLFFSPADIARVKALREGNLREAVLRAHGANPLIPALFVFTYPAYPLERLSAALRALSSPVNVLLAPGAAGERLAALLSGSVHHTVRLPYLSQADFDDVIWSSDLALIRGEESFVRAQIGGVPALWSIYPTEDMAHEVKLEAWMRLSSADWPAADAELFRRAQTLWVNGVTLPGMETEKARFQRGDGDTAAFTEAFAALMGSLTRLTDHSRTWQQRLLSHGDLAGAILAEVPLAPGEAFRTGTV